MLEIRTKLAKRGWIDQEIDLATKNYGVRSVTEGEATQLLGFKALDFGIWFPFGGGYGQLRYNTAKPKYHNPKKEKCTPTAWSPTGNIKDCEAITEGWCDAFIGTQRGKVNVAATAGVSHVPSTLPASTGQTVLFDADGMTNGGVMQALIKAGLHLRGKIQLIPLECGPKAGCEEFFKVGKTADDFQDLLKAAVSPRVFLERWLTFLLAWEQELPKQIESLDKLYRKVFELAYLCDRNGETLALKVEQFVKAHSKKWIGKSLSLPAIRKFKADAERPYREDEAKAQIEKRKEAAKDSVSRGSWPVKHCLNDAVTISPTGQTTMAPSGAIAGLMEVSWGDELKYRLDFSSFYAYGRSTPGKWERVSDREVKELIQRELDATGAEGFYGLTSVESSATLLAQRVSVRKWPVERDLVPFKNGVLRLSDNTLLPHSPKYGFTWQLPYEYLPSATGDPIIEWMRWAVNEDETVVQLIRACLKAIVMGRTDFQKYLEIIGPGGTGKGTLIRLIQALLGRSNTVSTSLSRIASSRFETSRFMGKRLVFIPDADYNPTAVDVLKQLTGEDYIPWERKGENPDYTNGFTLEGWVMVATNKEVIASDHTNALFRRRIPIYFNRIVPNGQRRSLMEFAPDGSLRGDFADHLPGLFNWVLAMPDELMEAYIRNPRQYVGSMADFQATTLLNTNSLAQWVNDRVDVEAECWTKTGNKSNDKVSCLYPNYVDYCESANVKPISLNNFSKDLENLLQSQLGIDAERKQDRHRGAGFIGIRLVGTDSIGQPDSFVLPETVSKALNGTHSQGEEGPLSDRAIQRLSNLLKMDSPTFDREFERLSEPQMEFFCQQVAVKRRHPVNAS
ncbi:phage/plasmid primase, P4 family [Leptothoe sp. LEGE 181152]|nr:phage/plasmid primase, P4 family [Leptothoe sp. LEGE 181152]